MIKNAIKDYYKKLEELWVKKRQTHPMIPYQSKMPQNMYEGERNNSGYISWKLIEKNENFDFAKIETEVGFEFSEEIKGYFNSYYFLKMTGILNEVKISLTPITPLVNINVFLSERIKIAKEKGRDFKKIEVGNAEIDGADCYLIFVDNETGKVEVLDPDKNDTRFIANSFSDLINDMEPRC